MVSVGPSTMSFSPEKTHAEFAWSAALVGPPEGGIASAGSALGSPAGPFAHPRKRRLHTKQFLGLALDSLCH
jgi:hypothetical protein